MKGMYWVTKSGTVVESREPFHRQVSAKGNLGKHETAWCVRVATGGAIGNLRLDRLRPATKREVSEAYAEREAKESR